MALFKCKMCGGTIEFEPGATVGVCDSCGTQQTLPKLDDDRRANLYDRANHFRRNNEFDKAMGIYEQILNEDNSDAEAYWSLVLCRYGIEYVEDPSTHKRVPTVNRAQYTSIFADEDYKSAIEHADGYQKSIYEEEAKAIDEIQKGILAISEKEEPFDVFICYKETDNSGRRTQDSVLANDLYHQLTQEGFKVFFARITLEDKLGTAYEPYIFAALNSAKVMVVLGTKPEYFNAVWVKNEWSRYLALVKKSGGKKVLIPAYKDMDPYDLPEEFSHLQAQDMSKLGFMQDLIRGIKKIAEADAPKAAKETVVINGNANAAPLLKRAFMFLEDGDFVRADDFCEQVLNIDPENGEAYLGKLMAQMKARRQEDLKNCVQPFDLESNYQKAVRFGSAAQSDALKGYVAYIKERNENARLKMAYTAASAELENALARKEELLKPELNEKDRQRVADEVTGKLQEISKAFAEIAEFEDAEAQAKRCLDEVENCQKDLEYGKGLYLMGQGDFTENFEKAIEDFSSVAGWRDADEKVLACRKKIEEIRKKEAAAKAKTKKIAAVIIPIIAICVAVAALWKPVIVPMRDYRAAMKLFEDEKYEEAITAFEALGEYKDSVEQIENCKEGIKERDYNAALQLMEEEEFESAIKTFEQLDGYKDSADQIEACKTGIKERDYAAALKYMEEENYDYAITAFKALDGYKDSKDQIKKCQTAINDKKYDAAIQLKQDGNYDEAIKAFTEIKDHKDSADQIKKCKTAIKDNEYDAAIQLKKDGKYDEAIMAFKQLGNHKDSAEQVDKCKTAMMENAKVGSTFYFGSYEQDGDKKNGKEDIEWIVLEKKEGKAFVISKYALDAKAFDEVDYFEPSTWAECSLRQWLNGSFYSNSFSATEQNQILWTEVKAEKAPKDKDEKDLEAGDDTLDKVFLLSYSEAEKYIEKYSIGKFDMTSYCSVQAGLSDEVYRSFWLRTSGSVDQSWAYIVNNGDGEISVSGVQVRNHFELVRPVMWISL